MRVDHADTFARYWQLLAPTDGPQPQREYQFHPDRKWRFDFAWPEMMLAVEIDGGTWLANGGRHNTDKDREKLNAAARMGWRVMRYSTQMLQRDPQAVIDQVTAALDYASLPF